MVNISAKYEARYSLDEMPNSLPKDLLMNSDMTLNNLQQAVLYSKLLRRIEFLNLFSWISAKMMEEQRELKDGDLLILRWKMAKTLASGESSSFLLT